MAVSNRTYFDTSAFILSGIPGLEDAHLWISFPFALCYIMGLLGNFSILFVVGKEQTLHKPMYLLLCILGFTDICTSTSVVPKALCIFWFDLKDITPSGCLTQMVFFSTISMTHSAILVAMAFDRYLAICNPLRYISILSNACIAKLGLVGLIRSTLFILPLPLFLGSLTFCDNRMIPQTFCEPIAVAKSSCGDFTVYSRYGLVLAILVIGSDLTLIAISYCLIIKDLLRISSKKVHQKALNTCTAHLCVLLMYHTFSLFSILTQRFSQSIAPHVHILLSNFYVFLPPTLNPIIYGMKTKELHDKVCKFLCRV